MFLILDFGNTNTKVALLGPGKQLDFVIGGAPDVTAVDQWHQQHGPWQAAILASVSGIPTGLQKKIEQYCPCIVLDENTAIPITNRYKTPHTLGRDRLAAVVAAAHRFPGRPVLVIDAGTCITFDLVNQNGEYLGGAITPGMRMRFKALHTFTHKLPFVESDLNVPLIGDSTATSIQSGVLNGVLAEVDGIIDRYRANYQDLRIIMSGGDFKYFDKRLKNNIFALPNIVIEGLKHILLYNIEEKK